MLNVSKNETKIMHLGRQKGRKQTKLTVQHKQGENVEKKTDTDMHTKKAIKQTDKRMKQTH